MTDAPPRAARPAGLAGVTAERFDLVASLGGRLGVVESVLPSVVFVLVYGVVQELRPALVAAIAPAVVLAAWRLVRREPLTQALGGLVGVGVCAFVASRTGRAEDFFLPTILKNVAYAAAYVVSGLVRWPLLGLLLGPLLGEGLSWRRDPERLRVYVRAGWWWAGMFLLRVAVQVPLFLAGAVTALGVLSLPLGLPLFALTCWVTWRMLRRVPTSAPAAPDGAARPDDPARGDHAGPEQGPEQRPEQGPEEERESAPSGDRATP